MGSPTDTPATADTAAATTNGTAGTEVATRPEPRKPVHVPLGQALADMDQAWRMATAFAAADIVNDDLKGKPANAFLVMLYGQRLGLPPEVAINAIYVVKKRPRMSGQLLLAKVREAGHVPFIPCAICGQKPGGATHRTPGSDGYHLYEADRSDTHCTYTIFRGDTEEEHTETFTLDDAVQAGLCRIHDGKVMARSKGGEPLPWECYTGRMIMWRALGFCVDMICPEIKLGFVVEGELDGGLDHQAPAVPDGPALAPVAAKRTVVAERIVDQPDTTEQAATDQAAPEASPATESGDGTYDPDAIAAEMAAIEKEHRAEYGDGPQQPFDFGPGSDAGR